MSTLNDTNTKLALIKAERIKTQNRIKAIKEELLRLDKEENIKITKKNDVEKFIDSIGEDQIKKFIVTLFTSDEFINSLEYSKVIKHLDGSELLNASISNEKKYFGAFVITYCLLQLNMPCKDISKKFKKSRSWATYKAIEILTIRLKKYIDLHYNSHILHYKELHNIAAYSHSNIIKLSS